MGRKLTAVAALAAAATLVSIAAAGPVATEQRVSIQSKGGGAFVLTPQTTGTLKADSGRATFCCWTTRVITRDGHRIEVDDPQTTLVGKRGTLVVRNRMEWLDVAGGYAVFTGTWKVVRGTGDYANVSGAGHVAGITLPSGETKWQRDGLLVSKGT